MSEKEDLRDIEIGESSIEDFDYAVFNWLNENLDIHSMTNRGWKKVPVIWVAGEKVHQSKKDQRLRDTGGALILPLITVERTGYAKDKSRKGTAWAMLPEYNDAKGGAITVARRINQDKSATYANASAAKKTPLNFRTTKNTRVIYETITMPLPVYVEATYSISLRTEYQQQMNDMTQPFVTLSGGSNHVFLEHNNRRYEGFIGQDFSAENTVADMGEGERNFQTQIEFKVIGSIIGHGQNQEKPRRVIRENAVDVKLMRERVILQDQADFTDDKKYRE